MKTTLNIDYQRLHEYKSDRKKTMKRVGMLFISAILLIGFCYADLPRLMNYQGKLVSVSGTPVSGIRYFKFSLYTNATDVTPFWYEEQSVTIQKGYYSVQLGSQTAFPTWCDFSGSYYLGINIRSVTSNPWGSELLPRVRILPSPNSLAGETLKKQLESMSNTSMDVQAVNQYTFGTIKPSDLLKSNTFVVDFTGKARFSDIQTALTALATEAPSGGTVYVLPGVYSIQNTITMKVLNRILTNVSIIGAGTNTTIIVGMDLSSLIDMSGEASSRANHITVQDIGLYSQIITSNYLSRANIISGKYCDDCTLKNVVAQYSWITPSYYRELSGIKIENAERFECNNVVVNLTNFVGGIWYNATGMHLTDVKNSTYKYLTINAANKSTYASLYGIVSIRSVNNSFLNNTLNVSGTKGLFDASGYYFDINSSQNAVKSNSTLCFSDTYASATITNYSTNGAQITTNIITSITTNINTNAAGICNIGSGNTFSYNSIISSSKGLYNNANASVITFNTLNGAINDLEAYGQGMTIASNILVHGYVLTNSATNVQTNIYTDPLTTYNVDYMGSVEFRDIQSAFNAALNDNPAQATIKIWPGTYGVNTLSTISGYKMLNNLKILGSGTNNTIIYSSADSILRIEGQSSNSLISNIILRDISFRMSRECLPILTPNPDDPTSGGGVENPVNPFGQRAIFINNVSNIFVKNINVDVLYNSYAYDGYDFLNQVPYSVHPGGGDAIGCLIYNTIGGRFVNNSIQMKGEGGSAYIAYAFGRTITEMKFTNTSGWQLVCTPKPIILGDPYTGSGIGNMDCKNVWIPGGITNWITNNYQSITSYSNLIASNIISGSIYVDYSTHNSIIVKNNIASPRTYSTPYSYAANIATNGVFINQGIVGTKVVSNTIVGIIQDYGSNSIISNNTLTEEYQGP